VTAQEQVLGAVLADPRHAAEVLDRLTVDDFEHGREQQVFDAFDHLYEMKQDCTAQNVLDVILPKLNRNDSSFGVWLAELYENAPLTPPIDAVVERTYRRHIWTLTTRLRQACAEWPLPALLASIDREFTGALQATARMRDELPQPQRESGLSGLSTVLFDGSTAA
jgi:replicative DNA helicase